jgi:pimeloyl-ACP methyl ester carboxylesterase
VVVLREGEGEPLVLFHGILCTGRVWGTVMPLLADRFDVIAPTELGHLGGTPRGDGPVRFDDVVDDAERCLDQLGLGTAHLAGNSLGGWISLELARRGRARTVCALSPAGLWDRRWETGKSAGKLREAFEETRRWRRALPSLALSRRFRRWSLADIAVHGDRVSRRQYVDLADDTIGCTVLEDIVAQAEDTEVAPLDPAPCPITLAWAEQDRILPLDTYRARAESLVPDARFLVLEGVGHVPMYDDPALVAVTIAASTRVEASAGRANGG